MKWSWPIAIYCYGTKDVSQAIDVPFEIRTGQFVNRNRMFRSLGRLSGRELAAFCVSQRPTRGRFVPSRLALDKLKAAMVFENKNKSGNRRKLKLHIGHAYIGTDTKKNFSEAFLMPTLTYSNTASKSFYKVNSNTSISFRIMHNNTTITSLRIVHSNSNHQLQNSAQ
jgi:hypothetical protein